MKKLAIACVALAAFAPAQAAFAGTLVEADEEEAVVVDPFPTAAAPSLNPWIVAGILAAAVAVVAADDT